MDDLTPEEQEYVRNIINIASMLCKDREERASLNGEKVDDAKEYQFAGDVIKNSMMGAGIAATVMGKPAINEFFRNLVASCQVFGYEKAFKMLGLESIFN